MPNMEEKDTLTGDPIAKTVEGTHLLEVATEIVVEALGEIQRRN